MKIWIPRFGASTAAATPRATTASFPAGAGAAAGSRTRSRRARRSFLHRPRRSNSCGGQLLAWALLSSGAFLSERSGSDLGLHLRLSLLRPSADYSVVPRRVVEDGAPDRGHAGLSCHVGLWRIRVATPAVGDPRHLGVIASRSQYPGAGIFPLRRTAVPIQYASADSLRATPRGLLFHH
jgi:hypothetical protein